MTERFTDIKSRSISGEKVNCTIERNIEMYVEFKNDEFILSRKKIESFNDGVGSSFKNQELLKSSDWLVIQKRLIEILLKPNNSPVEYYLKNLD